MNTRVMLALCLFVCAASAHAFDTYRIGLRVISVGDTLATLREVAGEPARIVTLVNEYNVPVGQRWEYVDGGHQVQFTISNSRVVAIDSR